jgi:hypothetical protein
VPLAWEAHSRRPIDEASLSRRERRAHSPQRQLLFAVEDVIEAAYAAAATRPPMIQ